MIPVLRPSCSQAEIDAVAEVLLSGWWGMGPKCEEFEREMAKRCGRAYCVTVNSCTTALHLACLVSGFGKGDEVIVPALTFISTALAVVYCGAKPVFADVRPDTLCLDWEDAAAKWTERTAAAIPVDYAGHPALALDQRLPAALNDKLIIQDAAHSVAQRAYGDLVCLSFHPVKPLATGDGGAVLTDDGQVAERLRALRWCGIGRSTWERTAKRYSWDYDIQEIGYKYHWNDIQATIGLVQLGRLDDMNRRRREIAKRYAWELSKCTAVTLPLDHSAHTWHLFALRVDAERRDALVDHLAAKGISAGVHYKPLTHYPMFADQPTPPVTEREWRRLVSLPIYPNMTEGEQEQVIEVVKGFLGC